LNRRGTTPRAEDQQTVGKIVGTVLLLAAFATASEAIRMERLKGYENVQHVIGVLGCCST
jgi:hypothetical protein